MPAALPDKELLERIAANVVRLRQQAGLSQAELAEQVGIEPRHVQRIEHGRINFGVTILWALAVALGVEPDVLFQEARLAPPRKGRPPRKPVR